MLYAILCYNDEASVSAWSDAEEAEIMGRLSAVQAPLLQAGRLGPVARLLPTTAATTLRKNGTDPLVIDGPFAETKEQLLGFYVVDCADLDGVLQIARDLAGANPGAGAYEIRPMLMMNPGAIAG